MAGTDPRNIEMRPSHILGGRKEGKFRDVGGKAATGPDNFLSGLNLNRHEDKRITIPCGKAPGNAPPQGLREKGYETRRSDRPV
jgi:hypothetical protein